MNRVDKFEASDEFTVKLNGNNADVYNITM
jgi:hypothetical protein